MASPGIIELPAIDDGTGTHAGGDWVVVVFNNDHNTYDEVIDILIRATGCTVEEAEIETWEIDHLGKSVVHHGEKEECSEVADVIRQIGIRVEVDQE
jgi:ATP-dependent Clp protease adaptor protein ClpS